MNTTTRKTPAAHISERSRIGTGNRLCIRHGNPRLFHFKAEFPHLFKSLTQKTKEQNHTFWIKGCCFIKKFVFRKWTTVKKKKKKKKDRPGHFRYTNPNDYLHLGFSNRAVIKFSDVSVEYTASLFRVTKLVQVEFYSDANGWMAKWILNRKWCGREGSCLRWRTAPEFAQRDWRQTRWCRDSHWAPSWISVRDDTAWTSLFREKWMQ